MKSLKFFTLLSAGLTLVGGGAFAAPTEEAAAADAPLEIVWQGVAGPMSWGPEDGNPVELLIEERFDVSITPLAFPSIEARDLHYASGNTADKITIFPREDDLQVHRSGDHQSLPGGVAVGVHAGLDGADGLSVRERSGRGPGALQG